MFLQDFSRFRQRQSLRVIAREAQAIFVAQLGNRELDRTLNERSVSNALGIRRGGRRHWQCWLIVLRQRFEPAAGANGINLALRKDRAQPRFQRTAAVVVAEERLSLALPLLEAVQVRINPVSQLARTAGRIERVSGPVQSSADARG